MGEGSSGRESISEQLALVDACQGLQDAVYVKSLDGRYLMANAAGAATVGLTPETIVGKTDREIFPQGWEGVREADEDVIASGESQTVEEPVVVDGELRTFLSTKAPLLDPSGVALGIVGISTDITARKAGEDELRRREAKLAEAQAVAQVGSWEWDLQSDEARWSAELYRIIGLSPESFEPSLESFLATVHPGDRVRVAEALERARATGADYEAVFRVVRPNGELRTVIARARVFTDVDGEPLRMVGAGLDLTEKLIEQERLEASEALLNLSQELTQAGSFEWEIGADRVDWSDGMYRIFGLEPGSVTPSFERYLEFVHPDERAQRRAAIGEVISSGRPYDAEHRVIRADGQNRWIESRIVMLRQSSGRGARLVGACQDVTDRRREVDGLEDEMKSARDRALRDPLTGLANRTLAFDRLNHAFDLAQRRDTDLGVLFVDLDDFKQTNDRFGHAVGDRLLASAAMRMRESVRESDTVGRIGGDEFLIVCEEPAGAPELRGLALRLHEAFATPVQVADGDHRVSVSVGASAISGRKVPSATQLVEEADQAMYRAKTRGPGGFELHGVESS